MKENQSYKQREGSDEIDLVLLGQTMWRKRFTIVKITGVFIVFGLLVALFSAPQYTASSTFVPQSEGSTGGSKLGGLASLAGINLGGATSTSEIPPSLYPTIVSSVHFRRALLETPITVQEGDLRTTYREYYEDIRSPGFFSLVKKYTIGLPGTILELFRGDKEEEETVNELEPSSLIRISEKEVAHFRRLEGQLDVVLNELEGVVDLSFNMPEAQMSAEMAKAAEELLQKEVIAFKVQNAQEQLNFTREQFEEKRREFQQKQRELADFRDKNRNISSAVAGNELVRLETEYNFAFDLYTEMAKQLENSKLQVSKDTPVFSVIDPVSIPTQKSAPNRKFILLIYTVLGFIVACSYIFFRQVVDKFKGK